MSRISVLLLLAHLAGSPALAAQTKAQAQTPAAAVASSGFDSFIMLVPLRDTVSIKKQLKAATEAVTQADSRRQQAETMRLGARARIESKKVEIVRIKDRINLAKKENREADRVGLDAERRAAEREKGLFERREELRQSEIELEAVRGELAGLTEKALQLELQLASRRAGRSRKPAGGAGAASLEQVIGELEKQTLEAQRAQAAYDPVVANQEIKVIDRRLELLDAQQKLLGGN
jgi:chromosome segregation ATPase